MLVLDQQDEIYQSLESANRLNSAAEAADVLVIQQALQIYMDVAKKTAKQTVSFGEHNNLVYYKPFQSKLHQLETHQIREWCWIFQW